MPPTHPQISREVLEEAPYLADFGITLKKRVAPRVKGLRMRQANNIALLDEVIGKTYRARGARRDWREHCAGYASVRMCVCVCACLRACVRACECVFSPLPIPLHPHRPPPSQVDFMEDRLVAATWDEEEQAMKTGSG